jgi:hypothetical protein
MHQKIDMEEEKTQLYLFPLLPNHALCWNLHTASKLYRFSPLLDISASDHQAENKVSIQ